MIWMEFFIATSATTKLVGTPKLLVKLTNLQSALLVLIWVMYGGEVFTVFLALGNDSFDGVYRY